MDVLERFGKRLREKRAALGLSQEKFADKAKLDRTSGGRVPNRTALPAVLG